MVLGLAAVSRTVTELKRSDAEPDSGPAAKEIGNRQSCRFVVFTQRRHTWSVDDSDEAIAEDGALSLAVGGDRPCTALGLESTPTCTPTTLTPTGAATCPRADDKKQPARTASANALLTHVQSKYAV